MSSKMLCAKCGTEEISCMSSGLCFSCGQEIADSFRQANELDSSTQEIMKRKYGGNSIEEALVRKKFGPPKFEYYCSRCGNQISSEQASSSRWCTTGTSSEYCKSCQSRLSSDREKEQERNRDRFEDL